MSRRLPLLAFLILLAATSIAGCLQSRSDIVRTKQADGDEFDFRIFDNSETFSRCLAMNDHGAVLGVREVSDKEKHIFSMQYFFGDGKRTVDLPLLKDFSNLEVVALSNSGKAVGFASRSAGHPGGSLVAIVWDSHSGRVESIGTLPDDTASHAQDISADGKRICGYSTGANPARLRPCVWSWNDEQARWDALALPTIELHNPYMMAAGSVISPSGRRIAACVTEAILPGGVFDSSLYVWDLVDGSWNRKQVSSEQMRLRAMNDHGVMVGTINTANGEAPCRIDLTGDITILNLLEGDETGQAWDINNAGVIVGMSDDPAGPTGGPQGVSWESGKTMLLPFPEDSHFSSAYAINNRGQIAGFADTTFPDQTTPGTTESGEPQPLVKTLGFLLSPAATTRK